MHIAVGSGQSMAGPCADPNACQACDKIAYSGTTLPQCSGNLYSCVCKHQLCTCWCRSFMEQPGSTLGSHGSSSSGTKVHICIYKGCTQYIANSWVQNSVHLPREGLRQSIICYIIDRAEQVLVCQQSTAATRSRGGRGGKGRSNTRTHTQVLNIHTTKCTTNTTA